MDVGKDYVCSCRVRVRIIYSDIQGYVIKVGDPNHEVGGSDM